MQFSKHNRLPVILDSDTGPDDGVALVLAAAWFRERIALCLATYGNLTLEATAQNFKTAAAVFQIPQPIYRGAAKPLGDAPFVTDKRITFVEQSSDFPKGTSPILEGEDILYETLRKNGKSDYIALGPLTNLALLLEKHRDAADYINSVILMGGGLDLANVTPFAEYNFYCDAQSAEAVFASGLELHVVALNACNPTAYSPEELASIAPEGGSVGACVNRLIEIEEEVSRFYGNTPGIIYDAIALAYYICPDYFETRPMGLACVTQGERYGQSVADGARNNVYFVEKPDKEKILHLLRESVKLCSRK